MIKICRSALLTEANESIFVLFSTEVRKRRNEMLYMTLSTQQTVFISIVHYLRIRPSFDLRVKFIHSNS